MKKPDNIIPVDFRPVPKLDLSNPYHRLALGAVLVFVACWMPAYRPGVTDALEKLFPKDGGK